MLIEVNDKLIEATFSGSFNFINDKKDKNGLPFLSENVYIDKNKKRHKVTEIHYSTGKKAKKLWNNLPVNNALQVDETLAKKMAYSAKVDKVNPISNKNAKRFYSQRDLHSMFKDEKHPLHKKVKVRHLEYLTEYYL
jgi:hypothetical protein